MNITLKQMLPVPSNGMWDLEVAGYPDCPGGANKVDVGGGHVFLIQYNQFDFCGVEPKSYFTPAWVSESKVTLILRDDNGSMIADSVSCVYKTRFETSLLSFASDEKSANLLFGGSIEEDGTDVEKTVFSGQAVDMDFFDFDGNPLLKRKVKMGDPLSFKINITDNKQVTKVLPETCYFSASSDPHYKQPDGTLTFVKNNCFNTQSAIVEQMLPYKMERNSNGTDYLMSFRAFHFSNYGENLYVHCTLLACIGTQNLCEPQPECFETSRKKRELQSDFTPNAESAAKNFNKGLKEFVLTKYIVVEQLENQNRGPPIDLPTVVESFKPGSICLSTSHFTAMIGSMVGCLILLLAAVFCLFGRLIKNDEKKSKPTAKQIYQSYSSCPPSYTPPSYTPPSYTASMGSLPTITSF